MLHSGGNKMSYSQIGSLDHRRGTYTHGSRDHPNYDGSQEHMSHMRVMHQGSTQSHQVHRNTSKKSGVEADLRAIIERHMEKVEQLTGEASATSISTPSSSKKQRK